MQHRERVISTHGLEDPTILQIIADDADWLEKITLDSIDYNDTSSKFPLEFPPNTEPEDEDAALTAHLWDRDHASDLSAYEWNSDDLVSEFHSGEENTSSDEELPRLARKDEFEQGIRREGTCSREYRERWEEHHVFYKRKIEMRLEAVGDGGEDYEGHSYFSEGAWSSQVGDNWGTPATSGGAEWTTRSEEPWTAGDGWVEWKKEDSEPLMGPESPLLQERDGMDQEQGSGEMDDNSGELCLFTRTPDRESVSEKSAHNKQSSTPIRRHPTESPHTSSPTRTLHEEIATTHRNDISSPPRPTPRIEFRQSQRTARFRDPNPINIENISSSKHTVAAHILDDILDSCIEKTQALLADGQKALNSNAKLKPTSAPETRASSNEETQNPHSREPATRPSRGAPAPIFLKPARPAAKVVRVEGWWRKKGGGGWREVSSEDEYTTLCEDGNTR